MPSSGVQTCALRSEEHTSELQSHDNLVCRLLLDKKKPRSTTDRPGYGRGPSADPPGAPATRLPACVHTSRRPGPMAEPRPALVWRGFFFNDPPSAHISTFPPPAPHPV